MCSDQLERRYYAQLESGSDISLHLPKLFELASLCEHVTEFGVRYGCSTTALLHAAPKVLVCLDIQESSDVAVLRGLARPSTRFLFHKRSSIETDIEQTELLFIDTIHTYAQLRLELALHHAQVSRWIVFHDTFTFGMCGEDGGPGLLPAIWEFLPAHPEWRICYSVDFNNGLMVLEKVRPLTTIPNHLAS